MISKIAIYRGVGIDLTLKQSRYNRIEEDIRFKKKVEALFVEIFSQLGEQSCIVFQAAAEFAELAEPLEWHQSRND